MIRPLRRRHRWIVPGLLLVLVDCGGAGALASGAVVADGCLAAADRRPSAVGERTMSTTYRPVAWNPQKRRYDLVAACLIGGFLVVALALQAVLRPELTIETLLIRALGAAAFTLLHVILCIGPLARLDRRFLPLLYNRRHLGVMMFTLALGHGVFSIVQFHAVRHAQSAGQRARQQLTLRRRSAQLPFQPFGLAALVILFLMAATSHDFWLHNLTAPVWKALHMCVYVAYAFIVLHVMFGVLQGEVSRLLGWTLCGGVLDGVHACTVLAARREARRDRENRNAQQGRLRRCLRRGRDSGEAGGRDLPVRRARRGVSLRRPDLGASRTCASTRTARWAKAGSSTAASCVRGTDTNTCPTRARRRRRSPRKCRRLMFACVAGRVLVHPQPHAPGTRVEPAALVEARIGMKIDDERRRILHRLCAADAASASRDLSSRVVIGPRVRCPGVGRRPSPRGTSRSRAERSSSDIRNGSPEQSSSARTRHCGSTKPIRTRAPALLLVAPGKHGADALVRGLDGRHVALTGTRIRRGTLHDDRSRARLSRPRRSVGIACDDAALQAGALGDRPGHGQGRNRRLEVLSWRDGPWLGQDAQGLRLAVLAWRHSARAVRAGSRRRFGLDAPHGNIRRADWRAGASVRRRSHGHDRDARSGRADGWCCEPIRDCTWRYRLNSVGAVQADE